MCAEEDIQALLSGIRRQAQAERDELLAQAQAEAKEILARADAEIEAIRAAAMAELERQLDAEYDRATGQARMDRRGELLRIKRRLIRQAFDQAAGQVGALQGPAACGHVLGALIAEAVACVGEGGTVTVAESQADLSRRAVAERGLTCALRPSAQAPWTVIASSADGGRHVDNSLPTRLARAEAMIACEVSAVLFGRSGAGAGPP